MQTKLELVVVGGAAYNAVLIDDWDHWNQRYRTCIILVSSFDERGVLWKTV